jgi:hypothetical protein
MALNRDTILLENLRESLNFYQRSLVWGMTAAAAFVVITFSLDNPAAVSVQALYGELSRPAAWGIAFGLYYVLGFLAISYLRNVEVILLKMRTEPKIDIDVIETMLLYPSLATNSSWWVRVGSALVSPLAISIAFVIRLYIESTRGPLHKDLWWEFPIIILVIAIPYGYIAERLWKPIRRESTSS